MLQDGAVGVQFRLLCLPPGFSGTQACVPVGLCFGDRSVALDCGDDRLGHSLEVALIVGDLLDAHRDHPHPHRRHVVGGQFLDPIDESVPVTMDILDRQLADNGAEVGA